MSLSIVEEDEQIATTNKFSYFKQEVNNIIQSFDKSREWADLIRCLQRLIKILHKYSTVKLIPERLSIAKRLCQCLNPALPSGVHLKTLEVYEEIFNHIGSQRLMIDLNIYCPALFTHFPQASIQIKPVVMHIFQKYLFTLEKSLIPCISGLVISLLAGLEEEGSKIYKDTLKLFEELKSATHELILIRAIWKAVLISPNSRVCGFKYIQIFIQKTKSENVHSIFGDCKALVVDSLVASLKDPSQLVERGVLELLCSSFKLDSGLFSQEEFVSIQKNALMLLTKRDVSLSRRVYQWIFNGPEYSELYFENYTKRVLIDSFRLFFEETYHSGEMAKKPLQVLLIILKKIPKEKADQVLERFITQFLKYLNRHEGTDFSKEISGVVGKIFAHFPMDLIWGCLYQVIRDTAQLSCTSEEEIIQNLDLIGSVFNILPINTSESQHHYLPKLLFKHFDYIKNNLQSSPKVLEVSLYLAMNLFSKFDNPSKDLIEKIFQEYEELYCLFTNTIIQQINEHRQRDLSDSRVNVTESLMKSNDNPSSTNNHLSGIFNELYKTACTFLTLLLSKKYESEGSKSESIKSENVSHTSTSSSANRKIKHTRRGSETMFSTIEEIQIPKFLKSLNQCCLCEDSNISTFSIELLIKLLKENICIEDSLKERILSDKTYLKGIISKLWNMLQPEYASIHFEVVKLLVEMHYINKHLCSAVVSDAMLHNNLQHRIEGHRRFALIWKLVDDSEIKHRVFDDGLFLMLDATKCENSSIRLVGRSWLINAMSNINRLLDPLFQALLDQESISDAVIKHRGLDQNVDYSRQTSTSFFDERRSKYVLNLWLSMLDVAPSRFIQKSMECNLSQDMLAYYESYISTIGGQKMKKSQEPGVIQSSSNPSSLFSFKVTDYYSLLVKLCVSLMETGIEDTLEKENRILSAEEQEAEVGDISLRESVRTSSVSLLRNIILHGKMFPRSTETAMALSEVVIAHLRKSIETYDVVFQFELLGLLFTLLNHLQSRQASAIVQSENSSTSTTEKDTKQSLPIMSILNSQMFLPTLIQGIVVANQAQTSTSYHSFSLLQYWADYIIAFLPYLHSTIPTFIGALIPHFCNLLNENAHSGIDSLRSQSIYILIEGLKQIVTFCCLNSGTKTFENIQAEQEETSSVSFTAPFRLFTDFVKDVFTQEEQIPIRNVTPGEEAQKITISQFPRMIETICVIWKALRSPYKLKDEMKMRTSLGLVQFGSLQTKVTIEKSIISFVEPLLVKYPSEFMASIIVLWENIHPEFMYTIHNEDHELDSHFIDILNNLDSTTPDIIISSIMDVLFSVRKNNFNNKKLLLFSKLSISQLKENAILSFLHSYLRKSIIVSNSSTILQHILILVKEYIQSVNIHVENLVSLGILLKILHVFTIRYPNVDNHTNSKFRQQFKDVSQKLIETLTSAAVKDTTLIKKSSMNSNVSNSDHIELNDILRMGGEKDITLQNLCLLSTLLVEILDRIFGDDTERTIALVSSILPSFIQILRHHFIENIPRKRVVVQILCALQQKKILNLKFVKSYIWDLLMDSSFFIVDEVGLNHWKFVIKNIMSEKEKPLFQDLMARFISTPSLLFSTKESDAQMRARSLKRLAFILYSGEMDEYQSFLNAILEKTLETFKVFSYSSNVICTVFFMLRVLISTISAKHLQSLWPMILTELHRILSQPEQQDTSVLLEAIKFIDFVSVVIPEEFQIFKWVFIGDPEDTTAQEYLNNPSTNTGTTHFSIPLLQNLHKFAPQNANNHQLQKVFQILRDRALARSEERKPMKVNKSAASDLTTISQLAQTLTSAERQMYLHMCTSAKGTYHRETADKYIEMDFVDITAEDLDKISIINKQQEKATEKIRNQITQDTNTNDLLSSIPPTKSQASKPNSDTWIYVDVKPSQNQQKASITGSINETPTTKLTPR